MLGLSRNDASQQQAVAKYRDSFMPYRDGYAVKPSRHAGPILITAGQREILVAAYGAILVRSMRIMMAVLLGGTGLVIAAMVAFDLDPQEWMIMPVVFALVGIVYFPMQHGIRQTIAGFGPRPSILASDYAAWQRQRLRDLPWSAIFLPALGIPVLAMRTHMHLPPQTGDDYCNLIFMAALIAIWSWAIIRKMRTGRD